MKKSICLLLALAMLSALCLTGCGSSSAPTGSAQAAGSDGLDPVTLTVYSPGNENSVPTKTIIKYAELVSDASDGKITLEVHHSGELGNDAEAIESTRMGTIDIIFAGTSGFTSFYEPAKIYDLPFLFDSAEQACEIANSDIGEQVFSGLEQYGLTYLSEGDNGMRNIATTDKWKQINSVDDVAGLKIRVPTSTMYTDVWTALGATPVGLALTELAPALSNGTVAAQDNATYHLVANATYDDIKYYSFINYMWMGCTMAACSQSWAKLPEEYQTILKEQAVVAAQYSFDTIAADNETAKQTLTDAGVEFNETPDVQSFIDKLGGQQEYYSRYANEAWYDQDLIDAILAK